MRNRVVTNNKTCNISTSVADLGRHSTDPGPANGEKTDPDLDEIFHTYKKK